MAEDTSSQLDIYKYRRISERSSILSNIPATETLKSPNIRYELDDNRKQKTYAILQETRSEFTNSGLRSVLLIYSNPAWKLFVLTILFVEYIIDTCLYTFCDLNARPFWAIMLCICFNFVFMFDVCVIVGLKCFKRWRKTLNLVEPDTTKVVLDIILALPYAFLYLGYIRKISFDYQIIAPIMATIRVYRIIEYLFTRSSQAGSNQWTTFLSQYLIFFILSVHSWTCVWYLFSYRSFDIKKIRSSWSMATVYLPTEATFDWYFVCGYWSVMFLTTNALGDLYPVTTTERVTAILATLLGFLLTTVVFVGSLTSQFITITTRRSQYVRKLKEIQNHLSLIKMDADTTKRIIRYYEDLWYQKSGVFKPKLLKLLPYPLQMEICYDLNAVPLYSSLIFRKLPEPFLRRLSLNMTHQFYLPGDVVYSHNQNKSIMVCITSGVLELLSDEDDESPMISFTKGTCFGEIALAYNVPARCTVKAATYVECQVLRKTKFIRLMVTYPDLVEDMRKEILERINKSKLRKHLQGSTTNLQLNIFASKDRKKSSIKCLKDKLRYIQGLTDEDTLTKADHLVENFLDLYILSEHVKKRTTPFTCMNSKFPWILEYDCYLVKYWELYMLFIMFYICIAYPYYIGIKRKFPGGFTFYAQVVVIISLLLNLLMSSVTAIKTKKSNIHNLWGILRYRMNTLGFYLDLLAVIPFEFIVTIHTTVKYHDNYRDHLYYLCKGVKLCLVWRLSSFFESLEKKLLLNTIIVKVAKYCVYICLLSYWSGVILYMESCFVERCSENSWFSKALLWHERKPGVTFSRTRYPLVTSIYFAISILLSVGSGDHTPGDKYDMGFVAFLSLYGVLLAGYCISEFSAVVTHWSRTKTAFLEVIMTIDKFMQENNMHPAIKARIMAFYELQWQYNSGVELTEENWLTNSVVPLELRKKVLHQARFKALTSIRFFQVKNKAYIQTLTETARDIILPPGEIVYYGGTVTRELYIIVSGYVLVTSTELREKKQERVIGPGNHLGLLVLLYGVPAVSTVITLTHCKLTCVNHAAYNSALSLFPEMREHEGLMSPEELNMIERQAKSQNTDAYLKYYNVLTKKKRVRITNFLAQFFDNSFINVITEYNKRKMSYTDSFKNFSILNNVSFYLLMPIVIKPDGIFLKVWAIVRVITAFLLCIFIPIIVSMAPMCGTFDVILVVLECICYVDLYLMMHVAFYGPKNQLIYHPYLTAKNYLKGPFIVDLLMCFPWYALWKLVVPQHDEGHSPEDHAVNSHMFHCALRMINVLQIFKLYSIFWAESISALRRAYLMSVVHFFLLTLYFLNLYTSILIIITCRYVLAANLEEYTYKVDMLSLKGPYINTTFHPDGNMICLSGSWIDRANLLRDEYLSPTKVYLLAYYWSATSFSGAGFGDITAQDTTTMLLAICNSVHGVLFFGYVYARIASLKAMADQVVTKFQENLKHLDLFLSRENVPFHLKKTIMEYWKYQWKRTGGWSHQTILGKLHANLNEDAVLYMYEKTLREIPLFEDVEYPFFRAFAKKLKEQYYQKGYMVLRSNEVINYMYIIYRGKVDIMSEINEVEACMGPGGIFGNIRGASKCLTMSNIVASRNLDVLSIPGHEFYALLKSYPTVLRKVKHSVGTTSKDYVLPTIASVRTSSDIDLFPLTYEPGDDDDDDDDDAKVSQVTESPEKSIASHGSRSITSVANAYFIPASLLIFKPHKWFRSSILPESALVTVMEYLILFVAYMDFMLLVYQMAFQSVPYFLYICIATDIIFLFKSFLDIHCAYMNRYGDYVLQPRKVRQMYFSKVYLRRRDFLANLPICYMAFSVSYLKPHIKLALFSFLRTPQLFRISYLFTYRFHSQSSIGSANLLIKLTSIGIWASIMSHVNACLFFKLSCLTPVQCTSANWMTKEQLNLRAHYSEDNYFALYIAALWYMVNLLTITGTGDVSSQNNFEVVETTVIIILIKFCTGLLISEMSALISAHSSSRIAYDYQINELRDGLRDMDLSDHQMSKMWDYVRQLWNRQQGRQMPTLVHKLPFRLRCQVMQAVYGSHIQGSIIFSKTDDDFKRMLAMWMKHCVFFPGNYIVQCGDSDQCIYFIHRGQVEVITVHPNLTESIYDVLGPEDSFGVAQGLFVGVAHHFSFRARTVVDIVYLKLDQWKYLLDYYPKSAKLVQRKVENVYLAM